MKRIIIGSLIGGIILFIWSFLAWAVLPVHLHTYKYSAAQDNILKVLIENLPESGVYALPMADNTNATAFDEKYQAESEKLMTEYVDKPIASIYYLKEGYNMGGATMLRGFLFNFLAALAACIMLAPGFAATSSFFGRWWLVLVAGLFINACGPLVQYNWMGTPWAFAVDLIMDNFLNWGIVGLWFAYYFKPANG